MQFKNYKKSPLALIVTAALTMAVTNPVNAAPQAGGDAKAATAEKKDDKKWDVLNPPGERKTITIDTKEITWSNLDVSPDGKHIIFDMLGDIYVMPISGGEAKAVTADDAWNIQPRFSPDGKTIAFISDRSGSTNLWLMNTDGTNLHQVTSEKVSMIHNPAWRPDGNFIAVRKSHMGSRSIAGGSLWMYHKTGGKGVELREPLDKKQPQKNLSEPAFSPDGKYVYFSMDGTPGQRWDYGKNSSGEIFEIRRKELETGEETIIVKAPGGAIRPLPSPDGKKLAYVKRIHMDSALFIKDLESGRDTQVFVGLDRDLQEANGEDGNTPQYAWTPDGDSLVFWAKGKIHRVELDGKQINQAKPEVLPLHVKTTKNITPALRFAVDVAPDSFKVNMARWSQVSPDGKKVVFQALGYIYVHDIKSGKVKRLTKQTDHFEYYPQFSQDGKKIVYSTWDDKKLGAIRVVKSRGGKGKTITKKPGHYIQPSFSADGKQVLFTKVTGGYLLSGEWSMEPGLYTVSAKGGEMKKVIGKGDNPQFNSDASRIYYTSYGSDTTMDLYSINTDGLKERKIYTGEYVTDFKVSPDNKWIAFIQDYNVYVAPYLETGKTIKLDKDSKSFPVAKVSEHSGEYLNWRADSSEITWAFGSKLYRRKLADTFAWLNGDLAAKAPETKVDIVDLGFEQKADKPEGYLVLTGGTIITMKDADNKQDIIENGVIVIKDNRIESVGRVGDITIPAKAKVVDVTGKTLIPGLVDVHAHGSYASYEIQPEQNWNQFSNLAFGVTTIHDPSNNTTEIFSMSELVRSGRTIGPRTYSTGRILYAGNALGYKAKIGSYEDAWFHVNRLKEAGAISVKSYSHPQREVRQQVIAAGRDLGIMVVPEGKGKFHLNMTQVIDGHTGVEHAVNIPAFYDDVVQLWSQTDSGYTPTLGVAYGGLEGERYWYEHTNVWENERLMRYVPQYIVDPVSIRPKKAPEDHYNHKLAAAGGKKLRDNGVRVLLGAHGQREGLAAHWELWMLQQGGFTPWEALRAGTIDGAKYIGMDKDIGSLEAGKLADIAVIDGDVLNDFRRSEYVTHTVINGRIYDTKTMNEIGNYDNKRGEFFFETTNAMGMHPATAAYMEEKAHKYHWKH